MATSLEKQTAAITETNEQRAARIQKNLESMKQAREQEGMMSEFFKIHSGEKTILEFTGDFAAVWREFKEKDSKGQVIIDANGNPKMTKKLRYEYKVIDFNNRDKGVQTWAVSSTTSKTIDEFIENKFMVLKVSREGADMGTKYYFVPVTSNTGAK